MNTVQQQLQIQVVFIAVTLLSWVAFCLVLRNEIQLSEWLPLLAAMAKSQVFEEMLMAEKVHYIISFSDFILLI